MKQFTFIFSLLLINLQLIAHSDHSSSSLKYIQNEGQWNSKVLYKASVGNGSVFLENNTFTFVQMHPQDLDARHELSHEDPIRLEFFNVRAHAWKAHFINANNSPYAQGEQQCAEYHNYFTSRKHWAGGVPLFEQIHYRELYPGIDVLAYSIEGSFKYDLLVAPGSDPATIKIEYEGLNAIDLRNDNLILRTSVGEFTELKPYAYQVINGIETPVLCQYAVEGNIVSFLLPSGYNHQYPLVIDPTLVAATLSGTTGSQNYGHCATYDDAGNIYTGAISFGAGYPASAGAFQVTNNGGGTDIAISKLNPDGSTLIYATYLGGSSGDYPHSMVVSDNDELYVLGSSTSGDFPISATAFGNQLNLGVAGTGGDPDMVVTHFNASGTGIIGSTYVGGSVSDGQNTLSNNYGDSYRGEIMTDAAGNCYVACVTKSNDFPATGGAFQTTFGGTQDGVVYKMNPDLSNMLWATYMGGSGSDAAFGVRMDGAGNVYVCGGTGAGFLPNQGYMSTFQGGTADGYIVHLSANGSTLLNSSYWGTSDQDYAFFLDLDLDGDVYIYGQSDGGTSPVTAGVYSNPNSPQYIAKLDPTLTNILYSTVIGGGTSGWPEFIPIAFMVDNCEYAYFSGHSSTAGLPTSAGALQTSGGFYLGVIEPNATALNYATYYGGGGDHVDGGTSRFDPNGIVYQGVCTNNGFNTTPTAWSSTYPSGYDIGVFKIDFQVNPLNAQASANPSTTGCVPFTVNFGNTSTGTDFIWDFGDGSPTDTAFAPSHTYTSTGNFNVMLIAIDSVSCNTSDTVYLQITVSTGNPAFAGFTPTVDCATQTVSCTNGSSTGAGISYEWDMGDGNTYTDSIDVTHLYTTPGTYTIELIVTDTICFSADTFSAPVVILPAVMADISADTASGCLPITVNFTNNSNGVTYVWDFGDGSPVDVSFAPSHTYTIAGSFTVMLIATDLNTCNVTDTAYVQIDVGADMPINADFTVTQSANCNLLQVIATNNSSGSNLAYLWNMGDGNTYTDTSVAHQYSATGTYLITLTITDTLCNKVDDFTQSITLLAGMNVYLDQEEYICPNNPQPVALDAGTWGNVTYTWSNGDSTQITEVTSPGIYWVTVTDGTCADDDSVTVVMADLQPTLGYTESICQGQERILKTGLSFPVTWNTGEISENLTIDLPGTYSYTFTDQYNCYYKDSFVVAEIEGSPNVWFPDAFSPDGDGLNDKFSPVAVALDEYEMWIFDRWGEQLFHTESLDIKWDGFYKGRLVPADVYVYKVEFFNQCAEDHRQKVYGHVTTVR